MSLQYRGNSKAVHHRKTTVTFAQAEIVKIQDAVFGRLMSSPDQVDLCRGNLAPMRRSFRGRIPKHQSEGAGVVLALPSSDQLCVVGVRMVFAVAKISVFLPERKKPI